jgi:hypothetical protein
MPTVAYYNKKKGFVDEMAVAGKPLEDEDFISYVLLGLDRDYNSFVQNMIGKEEISLGGVYSQLLATKARLELQTSSQYHSSSANATTRGHGNYHGCGGRDGGRGGFGRGYGGHDEAGSFSGSKPICQLCKKTGHTVTRR